MTNVAPNHAAALPPASTSNYNVQAQAAALGARAARRPAPRVQEGRTDDIGAVARLYAPPAVEAAPSRPEPAAPRGGPLRLSDLAAAVSRAKQDRRAVAESGDPDGPDDGGYDPGEIVQGLQGRASMAASALSAMRGKR